MRQDSGTACGTGCHSLCFGQARPCLVWEEMGRSGQGRAQGHQLCAVTCLEEKPQPVSQGTPHA